MRHFNPQQITVTLSAPSIDEASSFTATTLDELQLPQADIYRCRLCVEEVLTIWGRILGEEVKCSICGGSRFGRPFILLSVPGVGVNPQEIHDDLYDRELDSTNLLYSLGLTTAYSYTNGCNEITLYPPRQNIVGISQVAISIVLALLISIILICFFPDFGAMLSEGVVIPVFDTMMNLLSTIAGPLIFLSVCSGIYSVGNLTVLGRITKTLISRFLVMTFLPLAILMIVTFRRFPITLESGSIQIWSGADKIFGMLLDIIPPDIITPFQTGNAMQIIFLAIACGAGILILGKKVSALAEIVGQMSSVVQLLMETVGRMVPLFVFFSILNLVLSNEGLDISLVGKQVVLCLAFLAAMAMVYIGAISIKWKVSPGLMVQKLLPTFLIAATTASSSAAFSNNVETCKKKLGITGKIVDFGIPMGQVIFMPAGAVAFLLSALCIGEIYAVTMTPVWVLTALLVSGILAIATPPIPGGALSCYTILFMQLGIPPEGVALAVSIDMLMDFVLTPANLLFLQGELIFVANKLQMLNIETIRKK